MSTKKKNFAAAPKPVSPPTNDQIEKFEQGGSGHDQSTAKPKAAEKQAPSSTKKTTIILPVDLHKRFKLACALEEQSMVTAILGFIENETARLEKKHGRDR